MDFVADKVPRVEVGEERPQGVVIGNDRQDADVMECRSNAADVPRRHGEVFELTLSSKPFLDHTWSSE